MAAPSTCWYNSPPKRKQDSLVANVKKTLKLVFVAQIQQLNSFILREQVFYDVDCFIQRYINEERNQHQDLPLRDWDFGSKCHVKN